MTCKEKLRKCAAERKAILAANFYNFETLKGLLMAAKQTSSPLILQTSERTLHYLGVSTAASMVRSMLKEFGVEGWLHMDHGSNLDLIKRCLDAGYDSVMIDASEFSIEENIKISRQVVKLAEPYGANVEAELGYIAKLGQKQDLRPTAAEDAKRFVEASGVDALAIAIGNAHGFYKTKPDLKFESLKRIREMVSCPLVLHGSSGIPQEQLQEAIRLGINKINLATETKNAFMRKLQVVLKNNEEIDLRTVFPKATDAVVSLITKKLIVVNT